MTAVIIHRQDRDVPAPGEYAPHQRAIPVTTRETVKHGFRDDGRPFLVSSTATHYKGLARSGKRFSRWATEYVSVIDVNRHGAWLSRGRAPKTGWNSRLVFAETGALGRTDAYRHLLGDEPVSMWDYYPTLSHFVDKTNPRQVRSMASGEGPSWGNSDFRSRFVGARDAQELTVSLFGSTRIRRDLVKAVGQSDLPNLYLAWQFRGLVPVDWLVTMMRDGVGKNLPLTSTAANGHGFIRPQVRTLDLQSLRNITRDMVPTNRWIMSDLSKMHSDVAPRRVRGWSDLHDALDEYRRTFGPPKDKNVKPKRPIKLRPEVAAIEGTTDGGLVVEIARHEQDLWNWGLEMSHCIGGYGHQMRNRSSILGAVRDTAGTMLGNFEIGCHYDQAEGEEASESWILNQLLGKHNKSLPDDARSEMEAHLKVHGVTCGRYWGATERPAPRQARAQAAAGPNPDDDRDDLDDDFLAGLEAFEDDLFGPDAQRPVAAMPF